MKSIEKWFSIENSGFGNKNKWEATSWWEFYKITNLNKIYTMEVNYWGNNKKND